MNVVNNIFRNYRRLSVRIHMDRCISASAIKNRAQSVEEELKKNPYYDKYANKISGVCKSNPEKFVLNWETHEEQSKVWEMQKKEPAAVLAKPSQEKFPTTKPKTLDSVMKLDLLRNKSAEEITDIWLQYHKNKDDCIAAVISKDTYNILNEKGSKFSTFVLPLPRNGGYEFIVSQFSGHEVHFTPLAFYQAHKENAPECLTIIHFPDLKEEVGIVLMKGEYNKEILNGKEAQCLANELQLYYGMNDQKKLNLLKSFTHSPQDFKYMDLVAELECISLKS